MVLKLREGRRKEEEEEGECNLYKKRPLVHISLSLTPHPTETLSPPFISLSLRQIFKYFFFLQKRSIENRKQK